MAAEIANRTSSEMPSSTAGSTAAAAGMAIHRLRLDDGLRPLLQPLQTGGQFRQVGAHLIENRSQFAIHLQYLTAA